MAASAVATEPKQSRKRATTAKQLRELSGVLSALASQFKSQADGIGKRPLAVDGARMPERAVELLKQFRLNIEKSRVAAQP